MSTEKIARLIKVLRQEENSIQILFQCTPAHEGEEYIIVSAVRHTGEKLRQMQFMDAFIKTMSTITGQCLDSAERIGYEMETFIFPASSNGSVTGWGELAGSQGGVFDPYHIVCCLGYTIVDGGLTFRRENQGVN